MREVRVYFRTTADPPPDDHRIDVQMDPSFARKGEAVVWHLHSLDPEVNWAMIKFDDPNARYFRTRIPGGGRQTYRMTRLEHKNSQILGTGPALGNGGPLREHKYTIEGWTTQPPDPNGKPPAAQTEKDPAKPVVTLDPVIIIGDP